MNLRCRRRPESAGDFTYRPVQKSGSISLVWFRPRRRARQQLLDLFGPIGQEWRPTSSDLHGTELPAKKLQAAGVAGVPDSVFMHRHEPRVLIAELKSRSAATPTLYERFQLVLYQGLAQNAYPRHEIEGVIRFRNQAVVVPFETALYEALMDLRGEYRRARQGQRPVDARPLATRLQIEDRAA